MIFTSTSLVASTAVFVFAALLICLVGTRITTLADQLADRSGIGEALMGGVLLGAITSMSGSVLSVTAAWNGHPELAVSNAIGGMAAQLAFLAVADLCYRNANLEHAAASTENMLQGTVLLCLLSVLLVAIYSPQWKIFHIHPGTVLLLLGYAYGIRLVQQGKHSPMWKPTDTKDTREDVREKGNMKLSMWRLWTEFAVMALLLALLGWQLQIAAVNISLGSGISHALMGGVLTAITTSLPELVTSIAAVRRGALTLAVSGIIGGNAYDSLFVAFSDIAYLPGSIYHTVSDRLVFWIAVNCLMTSILLLGLLFRERRGIGGIGFESALTLLVYLAAATLLVSGG